jgi:hypothetical protein
MRWATAVTSSSSVRGAALQGGEVETFHGLLDEPPLVGRVEHLADDPLGRLDGQVGDLAADLADRPRGLRLDLPAGLLHTPLPLGLGLLFRAIDVRVPHLARLGEDAGGLRPGLGEDRAVLLEQLACLVARRVRLLDRLADAVTAIVDRLLDRSKRVLAKHEERDRERDQRPDHEAGDDLDQPGIGEHVRHVRSARRRADRRSGRRTRQPR